MRAAVSWTILVVKSATLHFVFPSEDDFCFWEVELASVKALKGWKVWVFQSQNRQPRVTSLCQLCLSISSILIHDAVDIFFCLTRREDCKVAWKDAPMRQCCPAVRTLWCQVLGVSSHWLSDRDVRTVRHRALVSCDMRVMLLQRMSEKSHRCCLNPCFVPPPGPTLEPQKLSWTHLFSRAEQSQTSQVVHRLRCYCRHSAHRAICGCQETWKAFPTP